MKKLLILMMALIMTASLAACGGSDAPAPTSSNPASTAAPSSDKNFTPEQQALADEFIKMAEEFDKVADKVNANPTVLADTELVNTMNELADEIVKADEYFASPETLTADIMEGLKNAISLTNKFIDEANKALANLETAPEALTVPVEIFNNTGVDIYALALSPSNSEDWGENLISEVIKDGTSVKGELVFTADTLTWDILVQDSEETQLVFSAVDFSEANTSGANLTLDVTEGGEYVAIVH